MQTKSILLLIVLICSISVANTQTLSFIDPGIGTDSNTELLIYYGNGTLAGTLTTNDSITVDPNSDIVLHKRNKQMSIVDDPMDFMYWIVDTMGYAIVVIIAGVIIGVGILGIAIQAANGARWSSGGNRKW
jgi:hypothetical protein